MASFNLSKIFIFLIIQTHDLILFYSGNFNFNNLMYFFKINLSYFTSCKYKIFYLTNNHTLLLGIDLLV